MTVIIMMMMMMTTMMMTNTLTVERHRNSSSTTNYTIHLPRFAPETAMGLRKKFHHSNVQKFTRDISKPR